MFTRVLVLVDGPSVQRVVSWVRRLLDRDRGEMRLLMILPPARAVVADGRTVVATDRDEDGRRRMAEFALRGRIARLREDGLAASAEVRFGSPPAEAMRAIEDWCAEAIAVAERPARGWRAWLTRSVVQDILARSPVPVLIVRATGQRAA